MKRPLLYLLIVICVIMFCLVKSYRPRVAIVSMMKNPKNIEKWLTYHKRKGVDRFYIRLEDTPELESYLSSLNFVHLEIGSSEDFQNDEPLINYVAAKLSHRQILWATKAIKLALKDNIDWIIHIDSDELIDCKGLIQENISKECSYHNTFVIPNYEAKYKDIPLATDSCFQYESLVKCNAGGCVSYGNGKGLGKVSNKLQRADAHRFYHEDEDANDEHVLKSIRLLHFESCDFDQYVSKYLDLAKTTNGTFPFTFYNDSINVARSKLCKKIGKKCINAFKRIYKKYKVVEGFFVKKIDK